MFPYYLTIKKTDTEQSQFVKVDDDGNLWIQFLICRAFIQIISKVINKQRLWEDWNIIGKIPIDIQCRGPYLKGEVFLVVSSTDLIFLFWKNRKDTYYYLNKLIGHHI